MGDFDSLTIGRFRLHHFASLGSTQTQARKPCYTAGDVILSHLQTDAYGRRGRAWQAPAGNLSVTFIEKLDDPAPLSWLGYAVGLALFDAVQPLLAQCALALKWPNDLLIDGKKLSGLLLEVEDGRVLIGIGLNVAQKPETDQPVAALNDFTTEEYTPLVLLQHFLPRYEHWHELGQRHGFAALRGHWLARAAFQNQTVTARLANGNVLTGVFKDIDQHGALVLAGESGHYTITSADIYLNKEKND